MISLDFTFEFLYNCQKGISLKREMEKKKSLAVNLRGMHFKTCAEAIRYFNIPIKLVNKMRLQDRMGTLKAIEYILDHAGNCEPTAVVPPPTVHRHRDVKNRRGKSLQAPPPPKDNMFLEYVNLNEEDLIEVYHQKTKTIPLEILNPQYIEILKYRDGLSACGDIGEWLS